MTEKKAKTAAWLCGYIIEFTDGGEPEGGILHEGSREDCEKVRDMIPGVSYSGDRPIKHATIGVWQDESAEAAQL